mmetsp:Transcript_75282/g.178861  ORF Transcript_75282/g.178861 Transcript_75282/m.178861 type:complete len:148 (+) Transcript_75282:122-565(+)|eukprot:CAMPEP_0178433338 /NCGR_PEP_ID=MMETSP0689_2-20121128/32852_1 /TAXON_ID=160604 /ORGANISM="Amphidinium massartii, Strain CS-259" /LENGTH=147 /DNA_ID=CAMNT_0020055359 /DNA_START=122 /DNA_END=565 /DNA_ORIENTATION=+
MASSRRCTSALPAVALLVLGAWLLVPTSFVAPSGAARRSEQTTLRAERTPTGKIALPGEDENKVLPDGVGIRTGLSDLLKPLNSEFGVTAKEDSIPTYITLFFGIVGLFLFEALLLGINNQSVLLPPEDEFDEYVANFLPYFFFGEK